MSPDFETVIRLSTIPARFMAFINVSISAFMADFITFASDFSRLPSSQKFANTVINTPMMAINAACTWGDKDICWLSESWSLILILLYFKLFEMSFLVDKKMGANSISCIARKSKSDPMHYSHPHANALVSAVIAVGFVFVPPAQAVVALFGFAEVL